MINKLKKIQVGMVTYGNLKYTKLTYKYLVKNTSIPVELFVVVGKPNDFQTIDFLRHHKIPYTYHIVNNGFPYSINDIYDYFWRGIRPSADPIIIIGNDVMPFPGAIDKLVAHYDVSGFDWISGDQRYTARSFCDKYPEKSNMFTKTFGAKHDIDYSEVFDFHGNGGELVDLNTYKIIGDSHNLCLFSRQLFNRIGYVDTNYFPAYFEDNDYARRAQLAKLNMVRVEDAKYFHFWSRTIYEENMKKTNDKYFPLNKRYYISKWGGEPGNENVHYKHICIPNRKNDNKIVTHWRSL